MPLTLQFGNWSPDLKDVPVQVPDNQGPMTIPCADCLNVFYANGAYKSIPSPAPAEINGNIVQPIISQAIGAFSYYDNVEGQETVFVGSTGGIQQLNADGTWSQINIVTSQSAALVGQAMQFTAGNFANTDLLLGSRLSFTSGAIGPSVVGTTIVAGMQFGAIGFSSGAYGAPISPAFGTLVHQSVTFGALQALYDWNGAAFLYISTPSVSDPTKGAFGSITANGKTYSSASATYSYLGFGLGEWIFPPFGFSSGSTYPVTIA